MALVCVALWAGSLFLPAVVVSRDDTMTGLMILMLGWLGPLAWQFGWFGNIALILLLTRMITFRRLFWLDVVLAVACLLLAADALLWREMYFDDGAKSIRVLGPGYYLWFAAILAASLWTLWRWSDARRIADQDKSF